MASSERCDCGGRHGGRSPADRHDAPIAPPSALDHPTAPGRGAAPAATATDERPPAPPPYRPQRAAPSSAPLGDTRRAKLTAGLGAAGLGAACLYTASMDPSEGGVYPLCPLRALTGTDCALCGGLRATHALLNLDVERAAGHNLLVVVAAPLVAYAMVQWFLVPWGVRLPKLPTRPWMVPALVVLLVVFSVVRNLPWGPGPWLYSGY